MLCGRTSNMAIGRNHGYEFTLVLGAVGAGWAFTGGGDYSLDRLVGLSMAGPWWGEVALALALATRLATEVLRRRNLSS